jgi:serine-threonine kinase receptor-associated protein
MDDPWVRMHSIDGIEKEVLKAHHGPVHCVEFSPDGEMYASGSGELNLSGILVKKLKYVSYRNRGW